MPSLIHLRITAMRIYRFIFILTSLSLSGGLRAEEKPASLVVAIRYYQIEGKSHSHLYVFDGEAKTVRQLTHDEAGQDHDPVFSPDGGKTVYQRRLAKGNQWRRIDATGQHDQRLDAAPSWYEKLAATPPQFDYAGFVPIPDHPGEERLSTSTKPGDITFKLKDSALELVLKDDGKRPDPSDPSWHPKVTFLRGDGEDITVKSFPVFSPKRSAGAESFWTGPLLRGSVTTEERSNKECEVFGSDETVLFLNKSPFLNVPPQRAIFFSEHRGSTDGRGLFALDLNKRQLFELSPNGGRIIPLPGMPFFACICDQLYLPLGDGSSVNCSYLDLWTADLQRIRFAEDRPAIFQGASMISEGKHLRIISIREMRRTPKFEPVAKL